MKPFRYEIGDIVECVVTKFRGTVVVVSRHATGCDRMCVQPPCKDGEAKIPDCAWVDDHALVKVGEDADVKALVANKKDVGPIGDPPARGCR